MKGLHDNKTGISKAAGNADRQSAIELLKVFAIFLIVINHVTQTLSDRNVYVPYADYVMDVSVASTNIRAIILSMMRCFGSNGNTIFFVCSAWFLIDSKKANYKKILHMLVDIWVVSVIILILFRVVRGEAIDPQLVIKSLFPTTFSNNWYLTCYMIFYAIHPVLNKIIEGMDKQHLLRITLFLSALYITVNCVVNGLFATSGFATSELTVWITIYFGVAYGKKYLKAALSDRRRNMMTVLVSFCGFYGGLLITNSLLLRPEFSQKFPYLSMSLRSWDTNYNPFLLWRRLRFSILSVRPAFRINL